MNKIYHLYFSAWPTNKSTELKSSFNPGCVIGTECEVLQNDCCYTIIYKEHSNRQYNQLLCFYWCTRMYFGALPYQGHKFEARVCNREKMLGVQKNGRGCPKITPLQTLMVRNSMYLWNKELEAELTAHGAQVMDSDGWPCLTEGFDPSPEADNEKKILLSWWTLKICKL